MACPLEAFFLGLISTQLLWKGVMPAEGYSVNISVSRVLVEEGLCATVPCTFTYNEGDADLKETLRGCWKKETKKTDCPKDDSHTFQIIGNLTAGNCSLLIWNPQKDDMGSYYFRMQKNPRAHYSFHKGTISLEVTETQSPKITMDTMKAGMPTNITCATLGGCSRMPPNITWVGFPKPIKPHVHLNETQVYTSVVDFSPSPEDHKRKITCMVNYINETKPVPRQDTVQLKVMFKPQMKWCKGFHFRSNISQQNFTNFSQLNVQKGDSIEVRCKVIGYPSPNMTWVKGSKDFQQQPPNVLKLYDLKVEDSGTYTFQATNKLGVHKTSFELSVKEQNTTLIFIVTGVLIVLGLVVLIPGIILASKRYQRKRKTITDSKAVNTLTNVKKPSTLDLAAQEVNGVASKSRSPHESVDGDPEEIHYATLRFNVPNPNPDTAAEDIQTDYAEICPSNSQGKEA
ncbi:sialic acid-binding Ig-like lectin 13 [Thamnophis elegans]|uniref:sialic acid-binding Ig-like lectin 13 n=1 Tax=Thamnophis elegans TaxID=35005 RepID=UPI001378190D|nr:sialic acid-binding Ig-like lectin 13 [Thamnophis elegans]